MKHDVSVCGSLADPPAALSCLKLLALGSCDQLRRKMRQIIVAVLSLCLTLCAGEYLMFYFVFFFVIVTFVCSLGRLVKQPRAKLLQLII